MIYTVLLVILSVLLLQTHQQQVQSAICILTPVSANANYGTVSGTVTFTNTSGQIVVQVNVNSGLPTTTTNQAVGFHVHQYGYLGTADGSGVSGHYNPLNGVHAYPFFANRHVGDMGNLTVNAQGGVTTTLYSELMRLDGLASIVGRGLIIHGGPDDGVSQPSGNSGVRVAQCVVGIKSVTAGTNAAMADNTLLPVATVELLANPITFQNNRAISGRAVIDTTTANDTRLYLKACGFAANSQHALALGQFGDLTNPGTPTTLTTLTADANGQINANVSVQGLAALSGSSSVVGKSLLFYEGNATTTGTISLMGVIGAINANPGVACPAVVVSNSTATPTPTATAASTATATAIATTVATVTPTPTGAVVVPTPTPSAAASLKLNFVMMAVIMSLVLLF